MRYKLFRYISCVALSMLMAAMNIQAQTSWNTNLLTNPGCDNADFEGWAKTDNGTGWKADANSHQWHSSFKLCSMEQTINLTQKGFSASDLDAQPYILLSGMSECPFASDRQYGAAQIIVYLLDASGNALDTITLQDTIYYETDIPWARYTQQKQLPIGTRQIRFYFAGRDSGRMRDQYGPRFDNMWVSLSTTTQLTTAHTVTIGTTQRGSVQTNKTSAVFGELVKTTITADNTYGLKRLNVIDASGNTISVEPDSSFFMPISDVTVSGEFRKIINFSIAVDTTVLNGAFSVDKAIANLGDTVTITAIAATGFRLKQFTVTDADGNHIAVAADSTFIMPASDVNVSGEFELSSFSIAIDSTVQNGSFSIINSMVNLDDRITITAIPNTNYTLYQFSVTDANGNAVDVKFDGTFTMPASNVKVSGSFVPACIISDTTSLIDKFDSYLSADWKQQDEIGSGIWAVYDHSATLSLVNVDWLLRPVALVAGTEYVFQVDAKQNGTQNNGSKLTVKLGDYAHGDAMTRILIPETILVDGPYQRLSTIFTVPTSGIYWLGIKGDIQISFANFIALDKVLLFKNRLFNITVNNVPNGSFSISKSSAKVGDQIKITVTSNNGYGLRYFKVTDANGNNIAVAADSTFTMPTSDVTVSGEFMVIKDYYPIATRSDMDEYREIINLGYDRDAELTDTIDMADANWLPMGTETHPFISTFDGKNYVLKNLTVDITEKGAGLCGVASAGAEIRNLGILGGTIKTTLQYAGALIGYSVNNGKSDSIYITSCYNTANVFIDANRKSGNAGGLVGCGADVCFAINHCYNTGTIGNNGNGAMQENGGIAGWLHDGSTIHSCYNYGTLYGKGNGGVYRNENVQGTQVYVKEGLTYIASQGYCEARSEADFSSGILSYLLDNADKATRTTLWSQSEQYPVFSTTTQLPIYKVNTVCDTISTVSYAEAETQVACPSFEWYVDTALNVLTTSQIPIALSDSNTFMMPNEDVVISGYTKVLFNISIDSTVVSGTFAVNKMAAAAGDTLKIMVLPDIQFELDSFDVKTISGIAIEVAADSTFIMPLDHVIISGHFVEAPIEVNLVAKPSKLDLPLGTTEADVALALTQLKLYLVAATDTLSEVINDSTLWAIDMEANAATFRCIDTLSVGYVFAQGGDKVVVLLYIANSLQTVTDVRLTLYPNPAHNMAYLQLDGVQYDNVQVYDLAGRLVLTQRLSGFKTEVIQVSGLSTGIYQVKVGNSVTKLIVQQ